MEYKYLRGNSIKTADVQLETNTQITIAKDFEDASSKDDTDYEWDKQEVSVMSWSVQSDKFVETSNSGTSASSLIYQFITQDEGEEVKINVDDTEVLSGTAILTQLDIDAKVNENMTCSVTYTGVGALS